MKRWLSRILRHLFLPVSSENLDRILLAVGSNAMLTQRVSRDSITNLWNAEIRVFSQWGEDGILNFLCDSLEISKPRVVEFGAGNFLECNSRFLAEYRNASVVAVDSKKDLFATVSKMDILWKNSIFPIEDWITPESAKKHTDFARRVMGGIDILSIDIDGNDYWVMETLSVSDIRIIVVEYNPLFGHSMAVSVPQDDQFTRTLAHFSGLYFGASLLAWVQLFSKSGFTFVGSNRAGNNAFFVSQVDREAIHIPLPDLNNLGIHLDWRIRESRDSQGKLSLLSGEARQKEISSLPLVNLATGKIVTVGEANQL